MNSTDAEIKPIQTWAVVELMGHVKSAGMVSEETHFGTVLLRLDVPENNGSQAHTEFYGGSAIYRLTPCTEQVARLVLKQTFSVPIVHYELPAPRSPNSLTLSFEEDEDDDEDKQDQ